MAASAAIREVLIHSGCVSVPPFRGADVSAHPGNDGGARQIGDRFQEGRTLTLIHKNLNLPRNESLMMCAWRRRRTEVLLCLPSDDEHLLSNTDMSGVGGNENKNVCGVKCKLKVVLLNTPSQTTLDWNQRLWTGSSLKEAHGEAPLERKEPIEKP